MGWGCCGAGQKYFQNPRSREACFSLWEKRGPWCLLGSRVNRTQRQSGSEPQSRGLRSRGAGARAPHCSLSQPVWRGAEPTTGLLFWCRGHLQVALDEVSHPEETSCCCCWCFWAPGMPLLYSLGGQSARESRGTKRFSAFAIHSLIYSANTEHLTVSRTVCSGGRVPGSALLPQGLCFIFYLEGKSLLTEETRKRPFLVGSSFVSAPFGLPPRGGF